MAARFDRQLGIATSVLDSVQASLAALEGMRASLPSCLRAPEAMLRYLDRAISLTALLGATAAAESARTSALPLEDMLIGLESQEADVAAAAATSQANTSATTGAAKSTAISMQNSLGGSPPRQTSVVLPGIDEVNRLVKCIKHQVWSSVQRCGELLGRVPGETTLTDKDAPGPLNRTALLTTLDRVLATAAGALDRLGSLAGSQVTAHVADASAALSAAAGAGNGVGVSAQAAATRSLAAALRCARIALLVAETAKSFPTTASDLPTSDQRQAAAVLATLRAAQGYTNQAQKEITKLSAEMTKSLSKAGLGSAATPAAVLATAYAELARNASSVLESAWWCTEAVDLFPKAKAAAEAAIQALAPAPPLAPAAPTGEAEGEEGEDADGGESKKKEDPQEVAAKVRDGAHLVISLCSAYRIDALKCGGL
jgi:hypothetical protein